MRNPPPLAAIRAFEAAARTENFTAAAAELGMTQAGVSYQVKSLAERMGAPLFGRERGGAAVSCQVKSLEARMGAPLFVRERGRVRLTPLGGRLLPALSNAFDTIESAF